jgi:hypothetical protein
MGKGRQTEAYSTSCNFNEAARGFVNEAFDFKEGGESASSDTVSGDDVRGAGHLGGALELEKGEVVTLAFTSRFFSMKGKRNGLTWIFLIFIQ